MFLLFRLLMFMSAVVCLQAAWEREKRLEEAQRDALFALTLSSPSPSRVAPVDFAGACRAV